MALKRGRSSRKKSLGKKLVNELVSLWNTSVNMLGKLFYVLEDCTHKLYIEI